MLSIGSYEPDVAAVVRALRGPRSVPRDELIQGDSIGGTVLDASGTISRVMRIIKHDDNLIQPPGDWLDRPVRKVETSGHGRWWLPTAAPYAREIGGLDR